MKDIQVYVKVERYIKEWLEFHLGNPVRFPERSYENELLHRHLAKRPCGLPPEKREDNMVAIVITDCDHSRPEYYNYLGQRGQRAIVSAIDALFRLDLWSGCAPLLHSTTELNRGIDRWCADNGISLDAREAVRQKFYRIRKSYLERGIVLGKFYRKKTATIPHKNEHDSNNND